MDGTAREDGDSQPLLDLDAILALDAITDPIIDTLNAHDRVLTSTIAGVAEADRALDLAITGVTTTLNDDDDDVTAAPTMESHRGTHVGVNDAHATDDAVTKPSHSQSLGRHGRHQQQASRSTPHGN